MEAKRQQTHGVGYVIFIAFEPDVALEHLDKVKEGIVSLKVLPEWSKRNKKYYLAAMSLVLLDSLMQPFLDLLERRINITLGGPSF